LIRSVPFAVSLINELANSSTDYTCKDQNKELENQSKGIIYTAKEFSRLVDKEPIEQVIESWINKIQVTPDIRSGAT
jgi:hypothetical protein